MIRVLVVDDSALMRKEITRMLESDDSIRVVGTARNGLQVLSKVKELNPDVVTLDIEMPQMDGLTALKQVMAEAPCAVVMVSSLTAEGADITIEALENGALDFVHKPSGSISLDLATQTHLLIEKVKIASHASARHLRKFAKTRKPAARSSLRTEKPTTSRIMPGKLRAPHIVGVGVSTGGPHNLLEILPKIPKDLNLSILVVQHMPEKFTASLAKRLDKVCPMSVKEAVDGEIVERGCIYIAPGGKHMKLTARNPRLRLLSVQAGKPSDINCPSVDVLFESLSDALGKEWLGILLTGMGSDGADGLSRLRKMGGHTIAEAEETCTVFGMPKRAIERGAAEFILPVYKVPEAIQSLYQKNLF